MRVTFNIEMKADLTMGDHKRRLVFEELMLKTAKTLYAQSSLLSGLVKPEFLVYVEDDTGVKELGVFGGRK